MKKSLILLLPLLVSLPGCFGKKKAVKPKNDVMTAVDIPVADESVKSVFDQELEEFALADNAVVADDYSWIEEADKGNEFKKIFFEFDRYAISAAQEDVVEYDIQHIKEVLGQTRTQNKDANVTIYVDGHACHSAGSATYNLALSEKRARALKDRLVAAGVADENVKIVAVGRGQEMPAHINGKVVSGDRNAQAPNRRDEIRVVIA